MTVKCLSETAQNEIVRFTVSQQYNQTELAELFGVHRRTIQRVLIDHGVLHYNTKSDTNSSDSLPESFIKKTQEDQEMVRMLRDKGHTPTTLQTLMDMPALTRNNVELYLSNLHSNELAQVNYVVGTVRARVRKRIAQEDAKKPEAVNG